MLKKSIRLTIMIIVIFALTSCASLATFGNAFLGEEVFAVPKQYTVKLCYDPLENDIIDESIILTVKDGIIINDDKFRSLEEFSLKSDDLKFKYWSTSKTGKIKFDNNTKIEEGTILYGIWEGVKEVSVVFETNGGTPIANENTVNLLVIPPSENPIKDGYEFGGWYTDESLTKKFYFESKRVHQDIKLYAKWQEIKIIFTTDTYYEGIEIPNQITKTGFLKDPSITFENGTYLQWYADSNHKVKWDFEKDRVFASGSLFGKREDMIITYSNNDGIEISPEILYSNKLYNPDYIYKGKYYEWYKDPDYVNKWNFGVDNPTSSMTLYGKLIDITSQDKPSKWIVDYIKDSFGDKTDSAYMKYENTIRGTYTSNDITQSPINLTIESYQTYWDSTYIGFIFDAKDRVENEITLINLFENSCDCKIEIKSDDKIYKSYSVLDTTSLKIELYDNLNFNVFKPIYLEKQIKMVITLFDSNQKAVAKIEIPEFDTTGYANTFKEL